MKREIAKAFVVVGVCFSVASAGLYYVAASLSAKLEDGTTLFFPRNLEQLQELASLMSKIKEEHFGHVLLLFVCTYLWKQTFSIPGSLFMNILAGALFGVTVGLPLVSILTALGATACYTLSILFGRSIVEGLFPRKLSKLREQLNNDRQSLLFILLSLRLFPMSPNWLLNLSLPLLGVPLHLFFVTVFLGLIPYNLLGVQAGLVLSELQTISVFNWQSTLTLFGAAGSLVATAAVVQWCKKRNQLKELSRTQ